jgi:hypothetical protein
LSPTENLIDAGQPVDRALDIPVAERWNDGFGAGRFDCGDQFIAIVALVGDDRVGWDVRGLLSNI